MKKKMLLLLTTIAVVLFTYNVFAVPMKFIVHTESGFTEHTLEPVALYLNGEMLSNLTMPAVNLSGTTYVPLREVLEPMGATVEWNDYQKEAYIVYDNRLIVVGINKITANINGESVSMPVPARIMNSKTMVPLRFMAESMDFAVEWYHDEWMVTILGGQQGSIEDNVEQPIITEEPIVNTDSTNNIPTASDVSAKDIQYFSYPETEIRTLTIPDKNSRQVYAINASSQISGVDKMLLSDNRLIVDIINAKMNVTQTTYTTESVYCEVVRVGQFQTEPEKITRIVFDLNMDVGYKIYISDDRKTVYVEFENDKVSDISFGTDGTSDYVTITSARTPALSVFTLSNPDRLVIDLLNADIDAKREEAVIGALSKALRTGWNDENVSRVVIDLTAQAAYNVTYGETSAIVRISEIANMNIWYDTASRKLAIKKDAGLTGNMLQLTDKYYDRQYIITLPGDYGAFLASDEFHVNDGYINSVKADVVNGKTVITVDENRILAANVKEDSNYVYVEFVLPKEKYDRIVIIDPGHGDHDPGTQGFGLKEKDINLDMAHYLMELLEADGRVKAYSTRVDDTYMVNIERAYLANECADLFVSIHNNYFEKNFSVNGSEVHYYPHSNDGVIGISSKEVAEIMIKNITSHLNSNNRNIFNSNFTVLVNTTVPAVLCEIGYLSNAEEAAKLAADSYRRESAQAMFNGIMEVFSKYTPKR